MIMRHISNIYIVSGVTILCLTFWSHLVLVWAKSQDSVSLWIRLYVSVWPDSHTHCWEAPKKEKKTLESHQGAMKIDATKKEASWKLCLTTELLLFFNYTELWWAGSSKNSLLNLKRGNTKIQDSAENGFWDRVRGFSLVLRHVCSSVSCPGSLKIKQRKHFTIPRIFPCLKSSRK